MSLFRICAVFVFVVAGCLAAMTGAPAQEKKEPAKDKKDPQSTFEPRSKPGAGQKFLEKFVGDWTVVKSFFPQKGEPSRTEGECRQTMVQQGRFLQSEFTFQKGDIKTTGLGLIGFEPETGLFTSVWIDSRQTKMSLRASKDKFDGEEIVLYSGSLRDSAGKGDKPRQSRTVTRLEDNGRKIVHRQYNIGQGGEERLVMELMMTRKPPLDGPNR
jgi:Protein of unknown function (DUF1579)